MSSTRDLIAAALRLTALAERNTDDRDEWQHSISEVREMCARAMVQPDMAEVQRLLEAYDHEYASGGSVEDYDRARAALLDYVRGVMAERDALIHDNERLMQIVAQEVSAAPQPVGAAEVTMPEPDCVTFSRTAEGFGVRVDAVRMDTAIRYGDAREAAGYAAGLAAGGKDAERLLINVSRCEKTFSWDGEKKEYIPKLILEFHPVPMNSPYDAKGWVDRNALDAAIDAALRGEVKP